MINAPPPPVFLLDSPSARLLCVILSESTNTDVDRGSATCRAEALGDLATERRQKTLPVAKAIGLATSSPHPPGAFTEKPPLRFPFHLLSLPRVRLAPSQAGGKDAAVAPRTHTQGRIPISRTNWSNHDRITTGMYFHSSLKKPQ